MSNTPLQEISYAVTNFVQPNYPTTEDITNYVNLNTLALNEPTNGDKLLIALLQQIVGSHDATDYGAKIPMSSAQKKALYTVIAARLAAMATNLGAVKTAIDTYLGTLP